MPAGLIGRFSTDMQKEARRNRVFVARQGWMSPRRQTADSFAKKNGLYRTGLIDMDDYWQRYETELPRALDLLKNESPVPLSLWLRVLVPHITATFVRGREFLQRYTNRLSSQGYADMADPVGAMPLELQRRLAPVTTARWIIFHTTHFASFVNNDLGMCGLFDRRTKQQGWIYPIDDGTAIGIFPVDRRRVAHWDGKAWMANIEHTHDSYNFEKMNQGIASWASEFIYGATEGVVEKYIPWIKAHETTDEIFSWPFNSRELRYVEFSWHRLAAATHGNPSPNVIRVENVVGSQEAAMALDADWCPPLIFPAKKTPDLNFESLTVNGKTISLQLRKTPRRWGDYSISKDSPKQIMDASLAMPVASMHRNDRVAGSSANTKTMRFSQHPRSDD